MIAFAISTCSEKFDSKDDLSIRSETFCSTVPVDAISIYCQGTSEGISVVGGLMVLAQP